MSSSSDADEILEDSWSLSTRKKLNANSNNDACQNRTKRKDEKIKIIEQSKVKKI